jgi:putative tryptophan/tyrosine transport system substrate-binding protein
MRRRAFISLLGGAAAAWPLAARAQQPEKVRLIGVLVGVADDQQGQARATAFRNGMHALGWTDGRNIRFEIRFTGGDAGRSRREAADMVGLSPDLIVANGAAVIGALQQLTKTIPVVFAQVVDPVSSGFVESLARPGGNMTGFTSLDYSISTKWLEVLKAVAPRVNRVGVLRDPTIPAGSGQLGAIQGAAGVFSATITALDVREAAAIDRAVSAFAGEPNGGMIVLANPLATVHRERIIQAAAREHLPTIYPYRYFVGTGGLISYGIDNIDLWQRAAGYADRILKGQKPADLPVQAPVKFELAINLKTAKALGLAVPDTLLARADEVIE